MIRIIKITTEPNPVLTEKHSYVYANHYQLIITRFINGAIFDQDASGGTTKSNGKDFS